MQLMLPALGVAFPALQQLSPEGKGEVSRKQEQALREQQDQLQPSDVGIGDFWVSLLFLHAPRMWLLSGCPVRVSQWLCVSAVCVVWNRTGGRRVCVPS